MTAADGVFAGGYVESAAYNPGLPPFQAAIVAAVVGGMPSYDQVRPRCSGLLTQMYRHVIEHHSHIGYWTSESLHMQTMRTCISQCHFCLPQHSCQQLLLRA